jgi:multifunctional methyltransferase subunit TRM112
MVRLITHNLLACHVKGCTSNNFPLEFKDPKIELREAEFNADFLRGFMPKIEYAALIGAARQVCRHQEHIHPNIRSRALNPFAQLGDSSLPIEEPEMVDDDFLKTLHHVLLEVCRRFSPFAYPLICLSGIC